MTEELLKELAVMAKRNAEIYFDRDAGFIDCSYDYLNSTPEVHLTYDSLSEYCDKYEISCTEDDTYIWFFKNGVKVFAVKPEAGDPDD